MRRKPTLPFPPGAPAQARGVPQSRAAPQPRDIAQPRSPKLQLAVEVNRVLEQLRLTQAQAAARLGILQPHVSELARYRLERFSVERLMQFLARLGQEVEIRIHAAARGARPAARRILLR